MVSFLLNIFFFLFDMYLFGKFKGEDNRYAYLMLGFGLVFLSFIIVDIISSSSIGNTYNIYNNLD